MEKEICTCKHSRDMHDRVFSKFESGEEPRKVEKDGKCKANDCSCEGYVAEESGSH